MDPSAGGPESGRPFKDWEALTDHEKQYREALHVWMDLMMREALTAQLHGGWGQNTQFGGMHPQIIQVLGEPSKALGSSKANECKAQDFTAEFPKYTKAMTDKEDKPGRTKLAERVLSVWQDSYQGPLEEHPYPKEAFAWRSWLHYMYCSDTIEGWTLREASRCVCLCWACTSAAYPRGGVQPVAGIQVLHQELFISLAYY